MKDQIRRIEIAIDGIIVERIETMNFSTAKTKNYETNLKQYVLTYL
jgi:hypothetical protein